MHTPEYDDEASPVTLGLELRATAFEARREEGEDESSPRGVKVGEVGAVGFVEVIVCLEQGSVGREVVCAKDWVN